MTGETVRSKKKNLFGGSPRSTKSAEVWTEGRCKLPSKGDDHKKRKELVRF